MARFLRFSLFLSATLLIPSCVRVHHSTIAASPSHLEVEASGTTTGRIRLTWTDESTNEFQFRIERSDDGGITYAQVGTVPMNSTTYDDLGLLPGYTYYYRVTAWNSAGNSAYAGPVSASTLPILWTSTTGGPGFRFYHCAVYDSMHQRMIFFGGMDDSYNILGDTWVLDLSHPTTNLTAPGSNYWSPLVTTSDAPSDVPSPRLGASAILDSTYNRMILFAGQDAAGYENDVYILDLNVSPNPKWIKATTTGPLPSGRLAHSAVFDPAHQQMVIFGGNDMNGEKGDTEILSLPASTPFRWSSSPPTGGPIPRTEHAAALDGNHEQMLLFGGLDNNIVSDGSVLSKESWSLSLGGTPGWTQLSPSGGPTERFGHSMIFDPVNEHGTVFGGQPGTLSPATAEMWGLETSGAPVWIALNPSSGSLPPGRMNHTAVYDSAYQRTIVFGGWDENGVPVAPDTWICDF